ncbi:MAG: hypothetical protein ACR2J8_05065, partial [Thermomicrobiales bacterium]
AYLEAIDHCRTVGDGPCEASMAVDLGFCLASLGRTEEAAATLREGITIARELGPDGTALIERADMALMSLAEHRFGAMTQRNVPIVRDEPAADVSAVIEEPADREDEVFRESTLPPG